MNRKPLIWILGFIITLVLISGCRGSKEKTPLVQATAIPEPDAEKTTVTGKIFSTSLNKPYPKAPVWLAEVFRQGDEGAYIVDTTFSPSNFADDQGIFVIANTDPREYVIVVGDPQGAYEVVTDDAGKPRVWQTEAGKILDVGQLNINMSPP
jgi:hypothetical protein